MFLVIWQEMVEMPSLDRSLDGVVVSTFPLLAYQEGLFSKEEAGYVTNCLKDDGR
jgi:hypothetical protein